VRHGIGGAGRGSEDHGNRPEQAATEKDDHGEQCEERVVALVVPDDGMVRIAR
jgi:hypothetical protein